MLATKTRPSKTRPAKTVHNPLKDRPHPATVAIPDYDADETEFLMAVDRFRAMTGRTFPTCTDFLAIAKSLGYVKVGTLATNFGEGR